MDRKNFISLLPSIPFAIKDMTVPSIAQLIDKPNQSIVQSTNPLTELPPGNPNLHKPIFLSRSASRLFGLFGCSFIGDDPSILQFSTQRISCCNRG
jgi:hypothetical protein